MRHLSVLALSLLVVGYGGTAATATLVEGLGCSGQPRDLTATVQIHVAP